MTQIAAQLAENLAAIQTQIADAARRSGRTADEIELVAVTKYVDASIAALLLSAGCHSLGESRPQALWQKAERLDTDAARWHMIGHLQRNKIARTMPLVDLFHSVDSLRLLTAINDQAKATDQTSSILLEVNVSGDTAKHGFAAAEMPKVLDEASRLTQLNVRGLMTMAARSGGRQRAQRDFATLRQLRDSLVPNCPDRVTLAELSMGMSGDFPEAIAEGATIVRVGSALFRGIDLDRD